MSLDETSIITTLKPLSAPQRAGAIVVAAFALLSALALVFIVLRVATVAFLQRDGRTSRPPETLLVRTQLGYYAGCLILSNMFISSAGLIDFRWASHSGLGQGSACSAQAALMQIGIWATCWFTSALGVHTLISLVFQIHPARWHSLTVVPIGWVIALVAGLVPLQKSEVYGPIGLSCGITRSYPKDIFALEALPIILAALVSIAVYSVIFLLHGKLNPNGLQISRGSITDEHGEDRFEEYHGFIGTIIWAMFWFPLALVLLLLPFCIAHILMYAGNSVPFALSIVSDVCVSMLGFVNVCLLCNTFRVISPTYYGPHSNRVFIDTVRTFGHDASGESPIVPRTKLHSRHIIPSYENGRRVCNPIHTSSNHSHDPSWATVTSNKELLDSEAASHESPKTKPARSASSGITPPAWLSRQVGVPMASLDPRPRDSFTRNPGPEPSTRTQRLPSQPMTDSDASRKKPTFRSKAPPALDLSRFPRPLISGKAMNKTSAFAARLDIPTPSAHAPSQTPAVLTVRKLDQGNANVSALHQASIPRIEVNIWEPEYADRSQPPTSSSCPSATSDPDYSGEIIYIGPLPEVPEPNGNEKDTTNLYPLSLPYICTRSQRTTMTSVWSQDTGYTLSKSPGSEGEEVYKQLAADALDPGMIADDDGIDVGKTMSRRTPSGPRPPPECHVYLNISQ